MHFWLLINLTHVRVDKDADGRINEEEVKEVRVYHQIKIYFYYYLMYSDTQILILELKREGKSSIITA